MTTPSDDIISIYRRHARAWTDARGTKLMEQKWLDRFLSFVELDAPILDIGCGSGQPIAKYLVDQGHRVHGVDASPEMMRLFQDNLPSSEFTLADMRTLSLGRTFSGVLAWDSFFHLTHDDQRAMFPIFRAHTRPGGMLMFTSGTNFGEAIGTLEGDPLYHASLDSVEYRALLIEHGFSVVDHVIQDEECGGHTIWLARSNAEA